MLMVSMILILKKNKDAKKLDELSYIDVLNKKIKVMDATAISLCMDQEIPIIVYNLNNKGDFLKILNGEKIGTIVK